MGSQSADRPSGNLRGGGAPLKRCDLRPLSLTAFRLAGLASLANMALVGADGADRVPRASEAKSRATSPSALGIRKSIPKDPFILSIEMPKKNFLIWHLGIKMRTLNLGILQSFQDVASA